MHCFVSKGCNIGADSVSACSGAVCGPDTSLEGDDAGRAERIKQKRI